MLKAEIEVEATSAAAACVVIHLSSHGKSIGFDLRNHPGSQECYFEVSLEELEAAIAAIKPKE